MNRLRLMETFITIVQAGTFAGAARKLGVSRSLLTKHINQLEQALSIQILTRDSHNISLTDAGAEYYRLCVQILEDVQRAETSMMEQNSRPNGTLRILAPTAFSAHFLGSALSDFCDLYPDIRVSVTLWGHPIQPSDVIGNSFDVVVRTTPISDSRLLVRRIASFRRIVCASAQYIAIHGEPSHPSELASHRCLYHITEPDKRWRFQSESENLAVRLPESFLPQTNSMEIIKEMIIRGKGIGLLPEYGVYEEIRDGRLQRILPAFRGEKRDISLLFPHARFLPLKIRLFIDFLALRFRNPPWKEPRREKLTTRLYA